MQGSITPQDFDSFVHTAGLAVAGILAYVGLQIKTTVNELNSTITEIRGDMKTHQATDDLKHIDFEKRITALEHPYKAN